MKQARFTQDFVAGLDRLAKVPEQKATRLLRAIGSDVGEALIVGNEDGPGTPVDTGNARGHWYTTIGERDTGHPNTPDGSEGAAELTHAAMDNVALVVATAQIGDVVCFNNDADYIEELNHGHSKQAPAGMTDVVAANFKNIVERNARRLGIAE